MNRVDVVWWIVAGGQFPRQFGDEKRVVLQQDQRSPTTRSSAGGRREETRRGAVRCIKLECRAGEDQLAIGA